MTDDSERKPSGWGWIVLIALLLGTLHGLATIARKHRTPEGAHDQQPALHPVTVDTVAPPPDTPVDE